MRTILLVIGNCIALIGVYGVLDFAIFTKYRTPFPLLPLPEIGYTIILYAMFLGLPIIGVSMLFFRQWSMIVIGSVYIFFFLWAVELVAKAFV